MAENTRFSQMNLWERAWDRQGRLEQIKARWNDQRDEVVELTRPDLYVDTDQRGHFVGSDIVEGTAPWAVRTMALGFQGNLVSQNIDWRRSKISGQEGVDNTNQWLQDVDKVMLNAYDTSNYYEVLPKYILDGLSVGSPVMLSETDDEGRVVYVVPHYAENFLWRDMFGNDLGYHRRYKMTALEALERFGMDDLSEQIKQSLRNGDHYTEYEFLQVIYNRKDPILEGVEGERLPNSDWVQFYFQQKTDNQKNERSLLTDRYNSKPFSAWHYWRNAGETYARTPAWFAIFDIKGGDQVWRSMYVGAEQGVDPPMWCPDGMRALLSMLPGARNYAGPQAFPNRPESLLQGQDYTRGLDFAQRVNAAIERWFMTDLFRALNKLALGPERKAPPTAFQIQQMIGENAVLLGPGVQSFVSGLLETQDERMLEIQATPTFNQFGEFQPYGNIPEPPASVLSGEGELKVEFTGPLAIAQKQFLVGRQIQDNLASVGPLIEMNPDLMAKIRGPETVEYILEQGNFPQFLIVPQDEYEIQQAQKDRQREIMAMVEAGVEVSQIAKNLGDEVDPNSVLAQLA
jgi:hypothetical protein